MSDMEDSKIKSEMNMNFEHENKRMADSKTSVHMISGAKWRAAAGLADLKRVLLKEAAARSGIEFMKDALRTLRLHLDMNPSCQTRIGKIELVLRRKKNYQVFVGFQGSSGAGKSTLINALIGFAKLLPSSAERACTAVPVEVGWNKSNDPDAKFIMEVFYLSRDEFRAELEQTFAAIQIQERGDDGDDDEADADRDGLINETLDKIKYLYRGEIRTLDKMKATGVESLLSHRYVRSVLGSTKEFRTSDCKDFTRNLFEHIDSTGSNDGDAHWPLVKLVKVFVKAPLLQDGLTLVDLPGIGDVSIARSAVAENYQSKLSVTCILADARRAITEKNAHDLLEKVTKRNLQLDGLYNSKSLCFIVSQMDRDFDVEEYLDRHHNLRDLNVQNMEALQVAKSKISYLATERVKLTRQIQESSNRVTELTAEVQSIQEILKEHPKDDDSEIEISRGILAERQAALLAAEKAVAEETRTLSSYQKRIESLKTAAFHASSRLRQSCLKNKSQVATQAIKREFEDTLAQMGKTTTESLEVFCVAATLNVRYQNTKWRALGFPTYADTGIPRLRDWLLSTTFSDREAIAQSFLQEVDAFLDSNVHWINDKYGERKMPMDVSQELKAELAYEAANLEKDFELLNLETTKSFKALLQKHLYPEVQPAIKIAVKSAKKQVVSFGNGIHWSTHRSVNRNHGHWTDGKKVKHRWNEKLASDLKGALVLPWNKTLIEKVPQQQAHFVDQGQQLIAHFAASVSVTANKKCPDVASAIFALCDLIGRNSERLEADLKVAFESVTQAYRSAHRTIAPSVKFSMTPLYDACGREGGTGHFDRNKKAHSDWMKNNGSGMYGSASDTVVCLLDAMLRNLPGTIAHSYDPSIQDIKAQIQRFFEENTAAGMRVSGRKAASNAKANLVSDLAVHIEALKQAWGREEEVQDGKGNYDCEDDDEEGEDMFLDGDDLFDVSNGGNDDENGDYGEDRSKRVCSRN